MLVNSDIFLLLYVVRWQSGSVGVDDILVDTYYCKLQLLLHGFDQPLFEAV